MEDLQGLLEKINRDGVEKAEAEAKRIIADAQAKADALVASAKDECARAKKDAEASAAAYAERAAETIRQSARDVVIGVRDAVTALLENLLAKNVDRTLADERTAAQIVADAIRDLTGAGEIRCGEKLAAALKSQVAILKSFTVVTDANLGTGFTVRLDGGRVEHAFTSEVIATELARRLRPDLEKLLAQGDGK